MAQAPARPRSRPPAPSPTEVSGPGLLALLLYYRLVHGGRAIARRPPPA